jgi:pimeloyl-ACP methyl ester carboxylesterase
MLLHPEGGFQADDLAALVKQWTPHCRRDGLLLLVPVAADKEKTWAPGDLEFIGKAIDRVAEQYAVDPTRVVAHGVEEGGVMALRVTGQYPERVRGVALVNCPQIGGAFEEDPANPLALYVANVKDFPAAGRIKAVVENLRKQFLPITVRTLAEKADYLDAEQVEELLRWIDTLDRI